LDLLEQQTIPGWALVSCHHAQTYTAMNNEGKNILIASLRQCAA